MPNGLEVNLDDCTGCRLCESICAQVHGDSINPNMSRIKVEMFDIPEVMGTVVCKQCKDPAPCQEACPVDAISRHPETTAIKVDWETCVSCGQCEEACPINAVRSTPEEGKALICDICDGTPHDNPQCVEYCPTNCIQLKPIEEIKRDQTPEEAAKSWLQKVKS